MSKSPKNATRMNGNFSFQATCWRSKYDAYTINPLGISCELHDIKMEILMLVFMFYRFVPIKISFYRVFSRARTICWWYCILSDAIDLGRLQINTIVVSFMHQIDQHLHFIWWSDFIIENQKEPIYHLTDLHEQWIRN